MTRRITIVSILLATCAAALTSLAATTSTWQGGASNTWGSAYEGNWSGGYPSSTAYATFDEPRSSPITVQIDEDVAAYGVVSASGRTAGLNFTGSGTFTNHRGTLFEAKSGFSLTDWNINVVSAVAAAMTGTNIFHKAFDCSSVYNMDFNANSKSTLCDSARLTGQHLKVQAGAELECKDSSTVAITKDLNVYPGGSLKVTDNAVLTIRGLALPFSKEAGVSDGWTMDGGKIDLSATGGFNAAGRSLYFVYTNATKTVSGTGTIQMYKLDLTSASNTILRLDGPDLYVRNVGGQYKYNNVLDVRGGSTIGAYGADVNLANNWYTKFSGSAAIDTTDYADKMTPRTITLTRMYASSGDLTVKGKGTVAAVGDFAHPNLNVSVVDSASLTVPGSASCANLSLAGNASLVVNGTITATSLAMSGDAHLAFAAGTAFTAGATFGDGNWTMEITIPYGYEAGTYPIVTGASVGEDFASHVTLSGAASGWTVKVVDGVPVLSKQFDGFLWTGDSQTSDNWSDSANWYGGAMPGVNDHVTFGGTNRLTSFNDTLNTASGLVFRASAGPFVLTGSVAKLSLKTDCNSRTAATNDAMANIVSHSGHTQTIAIPIEFPRCAYVLSDGGAEVVLKSGFYQGTQTTWQYFIAGGEVALGGNCSASKLGFRTATSGKPTTCLRLMPGCDFALRTQGYNSFTESNSYLGRLVIEEGATLTLNGGECSFLYGKLQNVVDGVFSVKDGDSDGGRIVAGPNEQYYAGSGTIFAVRARSGKSSGCKSHYVNFGGTLKLYMGGDWNTASDLIIEISGTKPVVRQDPNCPTRFRMTDGTTLGATADWTYGPAADAFNLTNEIVTAAGRASVMTGTVTVDTQDPLDATKSHTITFADPLDASAATIVKNGEGALVFDTPADCQPQFGSMVVNGGLVSFNAAQTFSGTLTLAAGTQFRADAAVADAGWITIATATEITGPGGATEWKTDDGAFKFRIVTSGGTSRLECSKDTGVMVFFL